MKRILLSILLTLSVFASSAQITVVDSIISGGIYRSYNIYIPAGYSGATPCPLIFNLHGYTSNATQQQLYSNFMPIADTAGFLMVYPQGTSYMGQPYWNAGISSAGVNDVQFISDLIDSLSLTYAIDQDRVYSCGMSNGGYMSQTLACDLSSRITAIASVTGSMFTTQYGSCFPGRPVPMMQISGNADATVPYNGSSTSLHIDTLVQYWVNNNNCNPSPAFIPVPNISTGDGSTAENYVYSGGDLGSSVELYRINGGGHTWPGSPYIIGVTNQDFNASEKIWLFFRKYTRNQFVGIADHKASSDIVLYPNPSTELLNIEAADLVSVKIYDINGRLQITSSRKQIDIASLSKGIYSVVIVSGGNSFVKKLVKG